MEGQDNRRPTLENKSFAPPRLCVENCAVQIHFLLGPAGSGKTHRCLAEIRAALTRAPEGAALVFLTPKQATFQLERQLLADDSLHGFTRLRILSFERLARFVFDQLGQPPPQLLDEEGRLMVLRALLARRRQELKLFRASARLNGFAQQLSRALREFQRQRLAPEDLSKLAGHAPETGGLPLKLQDLALLLRDYLGWLDAQGLLDADGLLDAATKALGGKCETPHSPFTLGELWLDGFAEFSPQEVELLAAVVPHCERVTICLCLDQVQPRNIAGLSNWALAGKTFEDTRKRLADLTGAEISVEALKRTPGRNRFSGNPVLAHLEQAWAEPKAFPIRDLQFTPSLRLATCPNPEAEATLAAREILRFVRDGGRFREAGVILRSLDGYHEVLQRVLARHDIPMFLDRRESVSHHPLAELTRSALRLAAYNWTHEDFFAALKSGLVPVEEGLLDRLENAALARGWQGAVWQQPLPLSDDTAPERDLEQWRQKLVPPFQALVETLARCQNRPSGKQLTEALRALWRGLKIEEQLRDWGDQAADLQFPISNSVHATVWDQMNAWLDNVDRAFPEEALSLREWLPVLEAGLGSLAVGVIPPALDQVLVGTIDRSRNPEIRLALVLGMNEGVFPAPPPSAALLTDADRDELERRGVILGSNTRMHLNRERYFGYIACTRARQRLVLTCSALDVRDQPLSPSPFLARMRKLFPGLEMEIAPRTADWRAAEHVSELIAPLLQIKNSPLQIPEWERLAELPALKSALAQLRHFPTRSAEETLSPALARQLYGSTLRTSVSRLEQFAACPFRFFVNSGLRAEERKLFELDAREQGSFQHEVLAQFHQQLQAEGKRWRDLTPRTARERVGRLAQTLLAAYRDGLLLSSDETKFTARILIGSLEDFVETLVGWMSQQYAFDPVAVELPFGETDAHPAWKLDLGEGRRLALRGRIDRVDVARAAGSGDALCVVVDYKSSEKKLDALLVANGLQLQLLAYLNVLRRWPAPQPLFGAARLVPAGVFYVNLRGRYEGQPNRTAALAEADTARQLAYRHSGRYDAEALPLLDTRAGVAKGDQFNYTRKKDGTLSKVSREALPPGEFAALLDVVEENLKTMGREIFSGAVRVSPFRKGAVTACDHCDYQAICRIDPWTHPFRALKPLKAGDEAP